MIHKKERYIADMHRKKSEGFFDETLFVIFAVENEDEVWFKWGDERYKNIGTARFEGLVKDHKNSVVRPGYYEISESKYIKGGESCKDLQISRIVFYSRDYCMLAFPDEKIEASGVVEEVTPKNGKKYYRIVIGYFDSYLGKRRDEEYIKIIDD